MIKPRIKLYGKTQISKNECIELWKCQSGTITAYAYTPSDAYNKWKLRFDDYGRNFTL